MLKIPKMNIPEERSSDGVSLLISILVRFPQIGTIQFESKSRHLRLNFMLSQSISPEDIQTFQTKIAANLKAYHFITGKSPICVKIESKQPYEKFCMLSIVRDLASLSKGEMAIIISLLVERFHETLIIDDPDFLPDFMDDPSFPDDFIDSMLENVRFQRSAKSLTALRENGRVLVFNK
jgi:hypothetical protein